MDLTRKTPPKKGPFEMECLCGEMLKGETDEALYDLYQLHVTKIHPPTTAQWAAASRLIEQAKEAKKG